MQRIGYTKGPSASELEAFNKIFNGNLTASNAEVLEALFPDNEKGSSRQTRRRKATSWIAPLRRFWLFFHLCNIETRGPLLG
jgi:hypothetical protein